MLPGFELFPRLCWVGETAATACDQALQSDGQLSTSLLLSAAAWF